MKKLTILIDIDDTIENLCEVWCEMLNEKHRTSVNYNDVTEWDIKRFFPELSDDDIYEPLHNTEIWERLKPKAMAPEYVKKLMDDGHDVYLCTTTDYRNVRPKYEAVVKKHFPFIEWSHVIVAGKKQMIKGDVLIDDGIHNLEGGDYIKILVTAPHNAAYDANANGIIRADGWKEIYQIVCGFATEDEDKTVVLYSIGCPRCKALKEALERYNIQFVEENNIEKMVSLGIDVVPYLGVGNKLLNFIDAMSWVREQK